MARGGRQGVAGSSGEDYIEDKDAKHLLDSIGKIVHDQVKEEAERRSNGDLKGNLSSATEGSSETASSIDTCQLVNQYISKVGGNGERHPCKELSGNVGENRFSDTLGGQCTDSKMRSGGIGACAPYRRLHLCHHNLETIDTKSTTSDTLLAEVCMAAKHEGETLTTQHGQHHRDSTGSTICTVLARSFADIGDIVRGRDLYRGNDKEKDQRKQLDKKLKEIFKEIHEGLTKKGAQTRYNGDGPEFFKLREDWWDANRETVWKAMTCSEQLSNSKYFRGTCGGSGKTGTQAKKQCRCTKTSGANAGKANDNVNIVPTYFDYVPQYLRWFEEWAEDFCRLRKHKLKDAKNKCREKDKGGKKLYCDLNRYDCEKTASGKHDFFEEDDCKDCHFSCAGFVKWIDNQKLEFLKQREKYKSEIKKYTNGESRGGGRKKRGARASDDNGYESKFYDKLKKNNYVKVDKFLEKLNEEDVCTKKLNDQDEEEGKIDFKNVKSSSASGDGNNKTFYRTTYCEACPWCGAEQKNGANGKWIAKSDTECGEGRGYNGYEDTKIPILTGDTTKSDMVQKYKKFCDSVNGKNGVTSGATGATPTANGGAPGGKGENGASGKNGDNITETWTCYYKEKNNNDSSGAINFCVLQDGKQHRKEHKVTSYNAFFWDWVHDMLHDSVEWKTELSKCINNESKVCKKNKCNDKCKCYESWAQQKEKEWEDIKKHFNKQGDIAEQTGCDPGVTLAALLEEDELLEIIEGTYGNTEETEHIRKMLQQAGVGGGVAAGGTGVAGFLALFGGDPGTTGCGVKGANGKNSIIDKLIEHELTDAKECIEKHNKCPPNPASPAEEGGGGGGAGRSRSETGKTTTLKDNENVTNLDNEEDDDSENEDEDEDEGEEEEEVKDTEAKESGPKEEEEGPKVEGKPACKIVDEALTDQTNLTEACQQKYSEPNRYWGWKCISGDTTSDKDGSICLPPRRRRLYVGKLEQWASRGGDETTEAKSLKTSGTSSQSDKLREAFIQSAAIETFFLWHRYKKENTKTQSGSLLGVGEGPFATASSSDMAAVGNNGVGQPGPPFSSSLSTQQLRPQLPLPSGSGDSGSLQPLPKVVSGDPDDPQNKLKSGNIPPDFLRQMFYTLGDYRDILFSGDKDKKNSVNDIFSGDKDIQERESKIKDAIERVLKNADSQPPSGKPVTQNSGTTPSSWWEKNGEHIWNGMICALTYEDNGPKGQTPKQDQSLKKALWDEANNKPKEDKYEYKNVKLEDESGTGPRTTGASIKTEPTKLTDFVKRPPFFRYLEEWGGDFCGTRQRMLGKIKDNCTEDGLGKTQKCSCYGEHCDDQLDADPTNVSDLKCPGCGRHCSSYTKWIEKKKTEYEKQKEAYDGQKKQNCKEENGGTEKNNGFCETLQENAAQFLENLGPCSKTDNDSGNGKTLFKDIDKTFGHENYCDPCSKFKIDCKKANCTGDENKEKCNPKTIDFISADDIKNEGNSTEKLDMLVSDSNTNGNKFDRLNECKGKGIFKGFREDVWECGKVCGYNVCKPKKVNGQKDGEKHIITIRALLTHWVHNFLDDYNKIKKKLNPCINDGKQPKCIKTCDKK
ncbi:hypothetical protein PFNF135_06156, partial [Plasmodium falciparum NF135/5.C10]